MATFQKISYKMEGHTSEDVPHFHIPNNTSNYKLNINYETPIRKNNFAIPNCPSPVFLGNTRINMPKKRQEKYEIIPEYAKLELLLLLVFSFVLALLSIVVLLLPGLMLSEYFLTFSLGLLGIFIPLLYLSKRIDQ